MIRALSVAATSLLLALTLMVPPAGADREGPAADRGSGERGAPTVTERSRDDYHIQLLEARKSDSGFDPGNSSNHCWVCYKYR